MPTNDWGNSELSTWCSPAFQAGARSCLSGTDALGSRSVMARITRLNDLTLLVKKRSRPIGLEHPVRGTGPGEETGEEASVVKDAAKTAAEGGVVKFDTPHHVRPSTVANWASSGQTV